MNFDVKTTPRFEKELKRLTKKYISLKKEYAALVDSLVSTPVQGVDLGNNIYKIRLAIASKNKGKSGGARIISIVIHADKEIVLVSIYDKSEKETIADKELKELIEQYLNK